VPRAGKPTITNASLGVGAATATPGA